MQGESRCLEAVREGMGPGPGGYSGGREEWFSRNELCSESGFPWNCLWI